MKLHSFFKLAFSAAVVAALSACPPPTCDPTVDDCPDDGGVPPPDYCNSKDDAVNDMKCVLQPVPNVANCWYLNVDAGYAYINPLDGGQGDQDWYSVKVGTLTPRSLLHVSGGYAAPATPVDLKFDVLDSTGSMSIATATDDHGQKPPSPIDIIVPFSQSNATLLVLVSDKGNRIPPVFDLRNPYSLQVCTQDNPDSNEPNDTPAMATPIANQGGMGTSMGVLATNNDEDWYSFDPGALTSRKILYLHITSPMDLLPPANYRLHYILFDPDMVPISEGTNSSGFVKVDLATARLLKKPGQYLLQVDGFKVNPTDIVPGDLRQVYTVFMQVLDDTDMTEPNDNMSEAGTHSTSLGLGGSHTFNGSLSYVPDPEWIALDVPALSNPGILHAKFSVAMGAGRFAPLPGPLDRQMRIMAPVKGATSQDSNNACHTNSDQTLGCPKGYDPQDVTQQGLVAEICDDYVDAGAAQCLWSERNEHSQFEPLRNMEAVIPVPAANATRYWIVVGDDGNNYADDLTWTLTVSLEDDPDEVTHGPNSAPQSASINSTVNGVISHGYGRLTDYDPNMMNGARAGIRGPNDYDAVPTDYDKFTFSLPGAESSWNLTWQIDHADGGSTSAKLALDIQLCDSSNACKNAGTLTYESGTLQPWYGMSLTDRTELYSLQNKGTYDEISLLTPACMCFESRFTTLNVTVNGTDRDFYGLMPYRLIQSTGAYPPSFTEDGGTVSCPAPLPDGGGAAGCGLE
jgi:hypothetical protein